MTPEPAREDSPSPVSRWILGAVLVLLAFCAVPVNESFASATFGFGVMRVGFAGAVAGLLWRQADGLWYPAASGLAGAVFGAIALQLAYPYMAIGELALQALLVPAVALLVTLVASKGHAKIVSAVAVLFVCGSLPWQVGVLLACRRLRLSVSGSGLQVSRSLNSTQSTTRSTIELSV